MNSFLIGGAELACFIGILVFSSRLNEKLYKDDLSLLHPSRPQERAQPESLYVALFGMGFCLCQMLSSGRTWENILYGIAFLFCLAQAMSYFRMKKQKPQTPAV